MNRPKPQAVALLTLEELRLDLRNPRLGVVESPAEALLGLIDLNPRHFRTLMASIRENGLDPGDSLYVIQEDAGYTVLEGNRRLAALQVLADPGRLANLQLPDVTRSFLAREALGFDLSAVEPLRCIEFADREEAKPWIRRRHRGARSGEGRIPWRPVESQRFDEDFSVADVIDFIGRHARSEDEGRRVEAQLRGTSTTLERMLNTAACRRLLRLSTSREGGAQIPMLGVAPAKAAGLLRRLVDDLVDGRITSRSMDKVQDREKYFNNLPAELRPTDQDALSSPVAFRDVSHAQATGRPTSKPPRTKASAGRGTKLAPKEHRFDTTRSTKLAMLADEAAKLPVRSYRFASALVLRATVDLAVNDYMKASGLPLGRKGGPQFTLRKKASEILKHLRMNGTLPSEYRAFERCLVARDAPCSVQALGDFAHNEYSTPAADSLQAAWDSLIPLLIATYGEVKGK